MKCIWGGIFFFYHSSSYPGEKGVTPRGSDLVFLNWSKFSCLNSQVSPSRQQCIDFFFFGTARINLNKAIQRYVEAS